MGLRGERAHTEADVTDLDSRRPFGAYDARHKTKCAGAVGAARRVAPEERPSSAIPTITASARVALPRR
jgi:hypothetical protein